MRDLVMGLLAIGLVVGCGDSGAERDATTREDAGGMGGGSDGGLDSGVDAGGGADGGLDAAGMEGMDGGGGPDAGMDAAGGGDPDAGPGAEACVEALGDPVLVTVPGTANPWLAGMPDGTRIGGDSAPAHSAVLGLEWVGACALSFSVTGGVHFAAGCPPSCSPPDGASAGGVHAGGALHGISNVRSPWNALVGVFLGPDAPDTMEAPATLDFVRDGTSFDTLEPELQQTFFIGDGLTGTGEGARQVFVAPAGATRLYLGTTDGTGWFDNTGAFEVVIEDGG